MTPSIETQDAAVDSMLTSIENTLTSMEGTLDRLETSMDELSSLYRQLLAARAEAPPPLETLAQRAAEYTGARDRAGRQLVIAICAVVWAAVIVWGIWG